jgi:hypothetical protein
MRKEVRRRAADRVEISRDRKKLSARKNQPLVTFGNQLARKASESSPPIAS